jgi:MFS transporter, VNT family, synaptic vesicle glycoprotein 2
MKDQRAEQYYRALRVAGFGKYQLQLLLLCGICNAADAVDVVAVAFLLPASEDDLHLNGVRKGWMSAMTFVGMLVGGLVWGNLADRHGRSKALGLALFMDGFFGLLSAFSIDYVWLIALRSIGAIG